MSEHEMNVEQQIADISPEIRPHFLLIGAGASRAALPNGDRNGKPVPLLRDVAIDLNLKQHFPVSLRSLAESDFESAYSRFVEVGDSEELKTVDDLVRDYFSELELPDEPNLYDALNLSLRAKDAIFSFNWDPFLLQSRVRLARRGLYSFLPKVFFLHGNVFAGFCESDQVSGLVGEVCSRCGRSFPPSKLLFPVEHKNYNADPFIKREWDAATYFLRNCRMLSIFGYSAPVTDAEAIDLLRSGWGKVEQRELEQTEIVSRPGADEDALRKVWKPFIHTHHYDVLTSFYDSFLGRHPRRSIEAWRNQFIEAKFLEDHRMPTKFGDLDEMLAWFKPLFVAEQGAA